MMTSRGVDFDAQVVDSNLLRIQNQIFKLLPMREEGKDWTKPLETLREEIAGMGKLFSDQKDFLTVLAKLEGLTPESNDDEEKPEEIEFPLYRRTIFECCSLIEKLKAKCQ